MVDLLHEIVTNDVKTIIVIIVVITVMPVRAVLVIMVATEICIVLFDIMVIILQ